MLIYSVLNGQFRDSQPDGFLRIGRAGCFAEQRDQLRKAQVISERGRAGPRRCHRLGSGSGACGGGVDTPPAPALTRGPQPTWEGV